MAATTQPALDVHQAAHVEPDHQVGAGLQDVVDLLVDYGRGDVRHLDREGAAEAAAQLRVRERDVLEAVDHLHKADRLLHYAQQPAGVARVVDRGRATPRDGQLFHTQDVDQELGELEGTGRQLSGGHLFRAPGEQVRDCLLYTSPSPRD